MSDLTLMQAHTIADALTCYALQPDSTDARIRSVIDALQAIGYTGTAAALEGLNEHSVKA
jgi:hypothetical protein